MAAITVGACCEASAVAAPTVVIGPATEITQTTARLNGTVNPNGTPVRYHFVFYEGFSPIDRLSHDAGAGGTAPVAVGSLLSGLIPDTSYSFPLVAADANSNRFEGTASRSLQAPPGMTAPLARTAIRSRTPHRSGRNDPSVRTVASGRPGRRAAIPETLGALGNPAMWTRNARKGDGCFRVERSRHA